MEQTIIRFCTENAKHKKIDFSIFKNPIELYKKYGKNTDFNRFKGNVFEMLLAELFRGNGFYVEHIGETGNDGGCDLFVKYDIDKPRFVLQAKNWNKNIDKYDIIKEKEKFSDNYKKQKKLSDNNFCFVAWNYVKGIKNTLIEDLNINVWDEQDIIKNLLISYKPVYPEMPNVILEPYQKIAFKNILRYWKDDQRCYVEHATGTGKTYIVAKLVETIKKDKRNKVLVMSPSDLINTSIQDLLTRYIPEKEMTKRFNNTKFINILTYQYIYHNSSNIPDNTFTHIIMDEAHRAGAPEWHEKGLLKIITKNTKIVGLSATMDRYSYGINIKEFLGNNCAGELSLFKAMAMDILPEIGKYVFAVKSITSEIKEKKQEVKAIYKCKEKEQQSILSKLNVKAIKDYSIHQIISKHYKSFKYQKIIAFCESYTHSNEIRRILDDSFSLFCQNPSIEKITSRGSKSGNKKILTEFSSSKPGRKQIKILIAIDMLNEGVDLDGIDSIMLFRKTESPRIYFQQIGRVLRRHGKDEPMIFDCVLNFQNININIFDEFNEETNKYRDAKTRNGFRNEELKNIEVIDEVKSISEIIEKVNESLNFYRNYEDARNAVQKLGITNETAYRKRYKEDRQLPSKPYKIYLKKGWTNWYDFFGTKVPDFYPIYNEAKEITQSLGIVSSKEYRLRYKEDEKLPSQPSVVYLGKGWISWNHFFGTKSSNIYENYKKASIAAQSLGIKNYTEYKKRYKEDPRLPRNPKRQYEGNGWNDFPTFLGVSNIEYYATIDEAKNAVKKLGIKSESEYRKRRKEDQKLPSTPHRFYAKKGWKGFSDFFGRKPRNYYETIYQASKSARKLSISSRTEYKKNHVLDPKLPSAPDIVYKNNGWISYPEFLGVDEKLYYKTIKEAQKAALNLEIKSRKEYITMKRYKEDKKLPSDPSSFYRNHGWLSWEEFLMSCYKYFPEAQKAVQKLNIANRKEYIVDKKYKLDLRLPSNPEKKYKNKGWTNWYDFLGTQAPIKHYEYIESKNVVQKLGIKSLRDYNKKHKIDKRLPASPSEYYKDSGWIDVFDFFGTQRPEYYESYEEANTAAIRLGATNQNQYRKLYKQDPKLHSVPQKYYKDRGWVDWGSFLGISNTDIYPSYDEAKKAVRKLNIKTGDSYRKQKLYKKDQRLPSSPDSKYKDWSSWEDFLGLEKIKKYESYNEAKKAARKLKCNSRIDYLANKRYLEDKGLTANPERKFKNKGWNGWEDFLGL